LGTPMLFWKCGVAELCAMWFLKTCIEESK
jgi:hypothetical protein